MYLSEHDIAMLNDIVDGVPDEAIQRAISMWVRNPGTRVDGVDYSWEGINDLRREIIRYRNQAMGQMPGAAEVIVVFTHVIVMLHYLMEIIDPVKTQTQSTAIVAGEISEAPEE
jgi:hypothetical protein